MTKYISNAFSLQMLGSSNKGTIFYEEVERPNDLSEYISVVGHPDTAKVLGVAFNRVSLTLQKGDELLVAQLVGGRLPEGATELPNGFSFKYYRLVLS